MLRAGLVNDLDRDFDARQCALVALDQPHIDEAGTKRFPVIGGVGHYAHYMPVGESTLPFLGSTAGGRPAAGSYACSIH